MAKRKTGLGKPTKSPPKTKKRIAKKHATLDARKAEKARIKKK